MTVDRYRLLVVDDHSLFRRGLIALLQGDTHFDVVGEAGDANQALRLASALQPDLILLDNHMPGVSGVQALPALRQAAPAARILMLTVGEDQTELAGALRSGAHGYLLKTVDSDTLYALLLRCLAGESVVSPEMTSKLVSAFQLEADRTTADGFEPTGTSAGGNGASGVDRGHDLLAVLSPRQREILRQITHGASNKQIARELAIAETTVKIHVQQILRKLAVSTRVQAAVIGREQGLH